MSGGRADTQRTRDVVAAVLTGGFALLTAVLVLGGWAALVGGSLGAAPWFACAAAVAVVVPLTRRWAERGAERLVFGADGDPYAVLARFVDQISGAIAV